MVVQYVGDIGIFSLVGGNMDRYMVILEDNEEYAREHPKVLKGQEDQLNGQINLAQQKDFVAKNLEE